MQGKSSRLVSLLSLVIISIIIPVQLLAQGVPDFERLKPVTGHITDPVAVELDQNGGMYVLEEKHGRIVIFSQGGEYLSKLEGLDSPVSLAVDKNGRIFVGSKTKGNVKIYDANLNYLGMLGAGEGEFSVPRDIYIDSSTGKIYVVDNGNGVVKIYSSSGQYISSIGSPGNGNGQFHKPVAITINKAAGEIIVIDRQIISMSTQEGSRVQFFDMNGVYLGGFTKNVKQEGDLYRPQDITVDEAGRLYISDSRLNDVLIYSYTSEFNSGTGLYDYTTEYLGSINFLVGDHLRVPLGIAFSDLNKLYVASRKTNCIEMYGIDSFTHMTVDPVKLTFTVKDGGEDPGLKSITIQNDGNKTFFWSAVVNDGWLGLTDESGVLEHGQSAALGVEVDKTGLAIGEYTGSITVSAGPGITEVVQVELTIEPAARLSVTPSSLSFTSEVGTTPPPETITIGNTGSAQLDWTLSSDQAWISPGNSFGITAVGSSTDVIVLADVTSLAAGTYTGVITVYGDEALDSPATVDVTLTLTESSGDEPTPADRVFSDMSWNLLQKMPPLSLNGVWTGSSSQVFVVGQAGTILNYDGNEWSVMDSPTDVDLNGVWGFFDPGLETLDVFAVGQAGAILHYNGSDWSVMDASGKDLMGVWGTGPTDVFAVGLHGTILHYNGTNWSAMDSGINKHLYGVWGSSGTDVYAVGKGGMILHYDGNTWSRVKPPVSTTFYGVWGSSDSDVYVVGKRGNIVHYDGEEWTRFRYPTGQKLLSIWGSSADNIYAVGGNGTILHNGGTGWEIMAAPTDRMLKSVFGYSESGIFAVGQEMTLLFYDGDMWQSLITENNDLLGVWGSSKNDVYAVGRFGTIRHYDGSNWQNMESPTYADLYGVWGIIDTDLHTIDIFAVGSGGIILHYDGGTWEIMASSGKDLYGIWGASSGDVFAVGRDGTIIHYDGAAWNQMDSGIGKDLYGVWGSSGIDVYAVGKKGKIVHYDGNIWSIVNSPTSRKLNSIWGSSASNIFVVGNGGAFMRYDGSNWQTLKSRTRKRLYGVWCSSETDAFMVGQGDTFLYYDGKDVQQTDFGTGGWLKGVWGSSLTTDIFAVGVGGAIIQGRNE